MNIRGYYIEQTLQAVMDSNKPGRFNFIEIGCMFKEDEGLSTYNIAKMAMEREIDFTFTSIDYDESHIDAGRALLNKFDAKLLSKIQFKRGSSLEILPNLLEEMGEVHFALIDGGAHPEVCLKEFELIASRLPDDGVCLVDDIVEIKPTVAYSAMRPFGKGTLIYPLLIVADYLKYREAYSHPDIQSSSEIIESLNKDTFKKVLQREFRILNGAGRHGMLAYGNKGVLDKIIMYKRSNVLSNSSPKSGISKILNKITGFIR